MTAWSLPTPPPLSETQLSGWLQLVEARTGIDFTQHQGILLNALNQRLRERGLTDSDAYFAEVQTQPPGLPEWQFLLARLTVKETSFFRQPAAFDLVRAWLRKRLTASTANGDAALDLWSLGCATGEEAFSLAITANEAVAQSGRQAFFGVLGTDICSHALAHGREAVYAGRRLAALSDSLRRRYFDPVPGRADSFQVNAALRGRVCFTQGNLMHLERMPALPMDVIFCQNVLIYFRRWRARQVLDALAERLKPGGLLVIGPGEAPSQWQHPALVRTQHDGVSAWLRCPDTEPRSTSDANH